MALNFHDLDSFLARKKQADTLFFISDNTAQQVDHDLITFGRIEVLCRQIDFHLCDMW